MGATRHGRRPQRGGRSLSRPTARVVPSVPTFAVDNGFWYDIPDRLRGPVQIGSIVRVPLSGRKTRGFVVEIGGEREGALKEIAALSSEIPVFDAAHLKTIQWAATHYVAPLSVLLERSAPPNLPTAPAPEKTAAHVSHPVGAHPLLGVTREIAAGRRRPATAVIGRWQKLDWLDTVLPILEAERSVLIVVATEAEAHTVADGARDRGFDATVASGEVARDLTNAWTEAQGPGRLVIGTPRVAMWRIPSLALAIVLEEGRRAMKDRQTPTLHVRDVVSTRARVEGFSVAFVGPTPSLEVLASGPEVIRPAKRAWPLVEIVDRRDDAPGSGTLAERTVAAIRATIAGEGKRSSSPIAGPLTPPCAVCHVDVFGCVKAADHGWGVRPAAGAAAGRPGHVSIVGGRDSRRWDRSRSVWSRRSGDGSVVMWSASIPLISPSP